MRNIYQSLPGVTLLVKISNLSHPNFGQLWPRNAPKSASNHTFSFFDNIENLKTRKLQITYASNLAQICTTSVPFLYLEIRVLINGWVGAHAKNHEKMPSN